MNKNFKQTGFTKKRQATLMTLVLVFLLSLTGTFAWQDYSQHKSNEFNTKEMEHNVVLVEDFEPVQDWSVRDNQGKQDKTVFVRNGQEGNVGLDDAFIRLQLKEYMDITKLKQTYSDKRFMIDTTGDFIRVKKSEVADISDAVIKLQAKVDAANINYTVTEDDLLVKTGYFDAEAYYYIITKQDDPNGQYGKFLTLTQVKDGNPQQITKGVGRQRPSTEAQHEADSNAECTYTPIKWNKNAVSTGHESAEEVAIREGHTDSAGNTSDGAKEFVKLLLNESATDSNVITYQSWQDDYNKEPVSKWILDTSGEAADKGYIYWGEPLVSGHRTKDLVEGVQLIKQPRGTAYYVLHVDMQAYSLDDMPTDIPDDLQDMYEDKVIRNLTIEAVESIRNSDKREDFKIKVIDEEKGELDLSQLEITLISAEDKSNSKKLPVGEELFKYNSTTNRGWVNPLIHGNVEVIFSVRFGGSTTEVRTVFNAAYSEEDFIKFGEKVYGSGDDKYFKVLYVADKNNPTQNINGLDKDTMLIIDEYNLSPKEFQIIRGEIPEVEYGLESDYGENYIWMHLSKGYKYPEDGYVATGDQGSTDNESIGLKSVLDAYSEAFIDNNSALSKYILGYEKPNEYDSDLYDRDKTSDTAYSEVKKNYTKAKEVNSDIGNKRMFALGVSDIRTYLGVPIGTNKAEILDNKQFFWLSSPGRFFNYAAVVSPNGFISSGHVSSASVYSRRGARGAFFINLNQ